MWICGLQLELFPSLKSIIITEGGNRKNGVMYRIMLQHTIQRKLKNG